MIPAVRVRVNVLQAISRRRHALSTVILTHEIHHCIHISKPKRPPDRYKLCHAD